jgi:hypothetical protein
MCLLFQGCTKKLEKLGSFCKKKKCGVWLRGLGESAELCAGSSRGGAVLLLCVRGTAVCCSHASKTRKTKKKKTLDVCSQGFSRFSIALYVWCH